MSFTYSVDSSSFAVSIFASGVDRPVIYQPDWPNNSPWGSSTEAELWAQLCIQSMEDSNAPYAPSGPGIPGEAKNIIT